MSGLLGVVMIASAVVISSLIWAMWWEYSYAHREQRMTHVVSAVSRRSHEIDNILLTYEGLLDSVALTAVSLYAHGTPTKDPLYTREDMIAGRGPPDLQRWPRYRQEISLDHPSYVLAPGATMADLRPELQKLEPLRHGLRQALLRSHSPDAVTWPEERADALLGEEGVAPAWVYLGLESGVLINYPGNHQLSPGYDPRARPWYTATVGTRGSRWGAPYPDDSGMATLLPCNMALYVEDQFIGVAGLDITLDGVIDMLALSGVPGVIETYLVDAEARVVVDSRDRGLLLGRGLNGNRALERGLLRDQEAREVLLSGREFGHVELEGEIIFFNLMNAVGWYYVVRVNQAEFDQWQFEDELGWWVW